VVVAQGATQQVSAPLTNNQASTTVQQGGTMQVQGVNGQFISGGGHTLTLQGATLNQANVGAQDTHVIGCDTCGAPSAVLVQPPPAGTGVTASAPSPLTATTSTSTSTDVKTVINANAKINIKAQAKINIKSNAHLQIAGPVQTKGSGQIVVDSASIHRLPTCTSMRKPRPPCRTQPSLQSLARPANTSALPGTSCSLEPAQ